MGLSRRTFTREMKLAIQGDPEHGGIRGHEYGQVRWLGKGDVVEQVRFIERAFGISHQGAEGDKR